MIEKNKMNKTEELSEKLDELLRLHDDSACWDEKGSYPCPEVAPNMVDCTVCYTKQILKACKEAGLKFVNPFIVADHPQTIEEIEI